MRWMDLFERLFSEYGPRGWWPLISRAGQDGRDDRGYLPGGNPPSDRAGMFEIAVGAVLTQNTAWSNAERAVLQLRDAGLLDPDKLIAVRQEILADTIRPAGYFNVKARKLMELSRFFAELPRSGTGYSTPSRDALLSVWGIGPETADSILLYAFGVPVFVVDEYTRRIAGRFGLANPEASYGELQSMIGVEVPVDRNLYSEFHALLVEAAKDSCRKKPLCPKCFLKEDCPEAFSKLPGL